VSAALFDGGAGCGLGGRDNFATAFGFVVAARLLPPSLRFFAQGFD
jgi:hypothetical protein